MNSTFSNNVRVLYLSGNVKKTKTTAMVFSWSPRIYCYHFLPSLNWNRVPEKKTISWSVTVYNKNVSSQCDLTAQIEQVQGKMQVIYGEQLSLKLGVTRVMGWRFLTPLSTIFQLYLGGVLLVEETGVLGENNRPAASHWQTLSRNVVWSTPRHEGNSNAQL